MTGQKSRAAVEFDDDAPAIGRKGPKRALENKPNPGAVVRRGIAEGLRMSRDINQLSLDELSAQVHIDAAKLSLMERGALRTLSLRDMELVMKAMGLVRTQASEGDTWANNPIQIKS
jgi:hypothetical protein